MSRSVLVVWLAAPILIVIAMGLFLFDRSLGKPNPALVAAAPAGSTSASASADPLDGLKKQLKDTSDAVKKDVQGKVEQATKDAKAALDDANPNLVAPESLPQGFIIVVTDKTKVANSSSPIFMPSSHNGWNPQDVKAQLSAQSDMKWRIVWEKPTLDSRVAFKFARGNWDNVECTAEFTDIDNRLLPKVDVSKLKPGEKPIIEFTVEAWKDQRPGGTANANDRYRAVKIVPGGRLTRIEVTGGGIPGLNRDALVWLPPGYDDAANASKTYPVLYMQDAQNVFEKLPAVPGEWEADETATRLITQNKIEPIIIVAIPHAGARRREEYGVVPLWDGVPARGTDYINFLLSEVKPKIDRAFRTKSGPENTAIGGSSMGAIIALEAGTEHPDVFGKVLAESLPMLHKDKLMFRHFAAKKNWPKKISFGMGGKEAGTKPENQGDNEQYVASTQAFAELMKGKGLGADRFKLTVDPEAVHSEPAWAKRFGGALEFLFPKQ